MAMMTKVSACSAPSKREGDEEGERETVRDDRERQERKRGRSEKERASRMPCEKETCILRLHYKSWESRKLITASEGCRKGPRETLKRAHLHPGAAGCRRLRNKKRPPPPLFFSSPDPPRRLLVYSPSSLRRVFRGYKRSLLWWAVEDLRSPICGFFFK